MCKMYCYVCIIQASMAQPWIFGKILGLNSTVHNETTVAHCINGEIDHEPGHQDTDILPTFMIFLDPN